MKIGFGLSAFRSEEPKMCPTYYFVMMLMVKGENPEIPQYTGQTIVICQRLQLHGSDPLHTPFFEELDHLFNAQNLSNINGITRNTSGIQFIRFDDNNYRNPADYIISNFLANFLYWDCLGRQWNVETARLHNQFLNLIANPDDQQQILAEICKSWFADNVNAFHQWYQELPLSRTKKASKSIPNEESTNESVTNDAINLVEEPEYPSENVWAVKITVKKDLTDLTSWGANDWDFLQRNIHNLKASPPTASIKRLLAYRIALIQFQKIFASDLDLTQDLTLRDAIQQLWGLNNEEVNGKLVTFLQNQFINLIELYGAIDYKSRESLFVQRNFRGLTGIVKFPQIQLDPDLTIHLAYPWARMVPKYLKQYPAVQKQGGDLGLRDPVELAALEIKEQQLDIMPVEYTKFPDASVNINLHRIPSAGNQLNLLDQKDNIIAQWNANIHGRDRIEHTRWTLRTRERLVGRVAKLSHSLSFQGNINRLPYSPLSN